VTAPAEGPATVTRNYCPTCGANAPDDECATRSGRDHPSRGVWRTAYAAGAARVDALTAELAEQRAATMRALDQRDAVIANVRALPRHKRAIGWAGYSADFVLAADLDDALPPAAPTGGRP
jgi:hypothetical protein